MKIVTDSSVMFTVEEGARRGMEVLPLAVTIDDETWLEYEGISAPEFLARVREGALPKSSCPPPQMTLSAYDTDEEIVHLAMAEGLSGSYNVACGLKEQAPHPERIEVVNTKTLCVPHRILALSAVQMAKVCESAKEVARQLQPMIDSARSYLLPEDFDYLRRGGRLTPLAAKFAHLVKAAPVMHQTDDGTRLERLTIARNFKKGVNAVIEDMKEHGVGENCFLSVSHADNLDDASWAIDRMENAFPKNRVGIFDLGPAFITQGGPHCVAI